MKRDLTLQVLLVLGSLVLLNYLASRHFVRLDLTEGRVYTLSSVSKEAVRNLDDILRIEVYFSKQLPPDLVPLRDEVRSLLDEYAAYSNGNLKVAFLDPKTDRNLEMKVQSLGVQPVQMNVIQKDRLEVVQGYLGMALFYADKHEVIPFVNNVEDLEYEITSRILKLTRQEQMRVGFLFGSPEYDLDSNFTMVRDELKKEYEVVKVWPDTLTNRAPQVDILIVVGTDSLTDARWRVIDHYLMGGGKALFLVDPIRLRQGLVATFTDTARMRPLGVYGARPMRALVLDRSSEMASFRQGFLSFVVPYPFWVKVRHENLSKEHPATRRVESCVLPWAAPLEITADTTDTLGPKVTVLAQTTRFAWLQQGFPNLNPRQRFAPRKEDLKVYNLAVSLRGPLPTAFPDTAQTDTTDTLLAKVARLGLPTEVIIVGNARFASDDFVGAFPENRDFFLNLVDWLGYGEELIQVRSKVITDRPLKLLSDAQKNLYKAVNTYGVSALIALLGLVVFFRRQRKKREG